MTPVRSPMPSTNANPVRLAFASALAGKDRAASDTGIDGYFMLIVRFSVPAL